MDKFNSSIVIFKGTVIKEIHTDQTSFWKKFFWQDLFFVYEIKDDENRSFECISAVKLEIGSVCEAISCRNVNGTDTAVRVEDNIKEKLCVSENFIEFFTYRFNNDFIRDREKSGVFNITADCDDIEAKIKNHIGKGKFIQAIIEGCRAKSARSFCKAYFRAEIPDEIGNTIRFKLELFLDYEASIHSSILIYIYTGRDGLLHYLPVAPRFSRFLLSKFKGNISDLEDFFSSFEFKAIGRLLSESGKFLFEEGSTLKAVITSSVLGTVSGRNHYRSRPISAYSPYHGPYDVDLYVNHAVELGAVVEATLKKNSIGKFIFSNDKKKDKKPEAWEDPLRSEKNIEAEEQSYVASMESPFDNIENLLTVHAGEKLLIKSSQNSKFNTDNFYAALTSGSLWSLHFDVMHYISTLKYATHNMIFRLICAGIIPHDTLGLTEIQQNLLKKLSEAQILQKTVTGLDDDGNITEITKDCTIRGYFTALNHFIDRLERLALVETMRFSTDEEEKGFISRVLVVSSHGHGLLDSMERTGRPFDAFFGVTPPKIIKKRLSANQLLVSFLCALKAHFPVTIKDVEFTPSLITKNEEEAFRADFLMNLKSENGNLLKIVCESVRNTAGITKDFDELEIKEKLPRILRTLFSIASDEKKPISLCLVATSFEEMQNTADRVFDEIKNNDESIKKYVHILLSYDEIIADTDLCDTLFELDSENGRLKRIPDCTQKFKEYMNE